METGSRKGTVKDAVAEIVAITRAAFAYFGGKKSPPKVGRRAQQTRERDCGKRVQYFGSRSEIKRKPVTELAY